MSTEAAPATVDQLPFGGAVEKSHSGPAGFRVDRRTTGPMVRELSEFRVWRPLFDILLNWAILIGAIWGAIVLDHWAVYAATVLIIGSRQHALAVLLHDASHYRMFPNRFWNDTIADLFCGQPILVTVRGFRDQHLLHHRYLMTDQDPDYVNHEKSSEFSFPMKRSRYYRIMAKDLLALNFRRITNLWGPYTCFGSGRGWRSWLTFQKTSDPYHLTNQERIRTLLFLGAAVALMVLLPWSAAWRVALLWFLGWYTMFGFCLRVRSIGEHRGVPDTNELTSARHVDPFLWERFGLYPHNISYHIVHHMFPSVPYYNLPRLHERLKQESPAYAQGALIEKGFQGVLGKLLI